MADWASRREKDSLGYRLQKNRADGRSWQQVLPGDRKRF